MLPTLRRCAPVVALASSLTLLGGCADEATTVPVGRVVETGDSTHVAGDRHLVHVPAGRLTIESTAPRETLTVTDTASGEEARAADGAVLLGLAWRLDPGAYPDDINTQVVAPDVLMGTAAPTLELVADDVRVELETSAQGRAWVAVPDGAERLEVLVGSDGLTQVVDLRTGAVEAGAAAVLGEPWPVPRQGACELREPEYTTSCLAAAVTGVPYVAGAGWAADGRTYAVVEVSAGGRAPQSLTLDGADPVAELDAEGAGGVAVFEVAPGGVGRLAGRAVTDDGRTVPLRGRVDLDPSTATVREEQP